MPSRPFPIPPITALLMAALVAAPALTHGEETDDTPAPGAGADPVPDATTAAEVPDDAADAPRGADLGETEVIADAPGGPGNYAPGAASVGTGTSAPIADTPFSIQSVPRQVLEDQASLGLEDVFQNVSGVFESGNTLNAQSEVFPVIRGFETPAILRNGLRATQIGSVDLVNIESVEVLKGPASILYGGLEPGGVLSYTTKQPLATPRFAVTQMFGNYNLYRTTADATGPLTEDGSLRYRLTFANTNSDSFRDEIELERVAVAPSLMWVITPDTDVTLDVSYTREEVPYDSGVPLGFQSEQLVPEYTFFGQPGLDGRTLEDLFVGYTLNHQIDDIFSVRNRFQFHRANPQNESVRHRGLSGTPGDEMLRRRYQNEDRVDDEYQLVTNLLADFSTGPVDHDALVGLDLVWQDSQFDRFRQNLPDIPITAVPPRDFVAPPNVPAPAFLSTTRWAAIYAQDQLSLLEDGRLKILLGGRFDFVDQEQDIPARSETEDAAATGRAGVLYEVTDWVAPFLSISQSFAPQLPNTVDQGGSVLDPEKGIQYEGGLKFELFDERLLTTAAIYQIDKEDVALFDQQFFNDTGNIAYFPGVDQRSRGAELDVVGRIVGGLSVIGNYAYTDTEVTANQGDPTQVGRRLGNVPLHAFRLWLTYNFGPESFLDGFGLGAGPRYESTRLAAFDDTVRLEEYVVLDAGAWYRFTLPSGQVVKVQVNLRNLLDEEYYTRASDRSIVHPGAPFTVLGSVGIEF